MTGEIFEWDDAQAQSNRARHGVDLETAMMAFFDPNAVEELDTSADLDEERSIPTGIAEGRILAVVYARHEDRVRILSAREATRHEQDTYYRSHTS